MQKETTKKVKANYCFYCGEKLEEYPALSGTKEAIEDFSNSLK